VASTHSLTSLMICSFSSGANNPGTSPEGNHTAWHMHMLQRSELTEMHRTECTHAQQKAESAALSQHTQATAVLSPTSCAGFFCLFILTRVKHVVDVL
jgi:hypothetical protein